MNNHLPACEAWSESIGLLAAGCLTASDEREVRQHLAGCDACRETFSQLESVCEGLRAVGATSVPPDLDIASRALVEIERDASVGTRIRWQSALSLGKGIAAALAASLLIAVFWQLFLGPAATPEVAKDLPSVVPSVPEETLPGQMAVVPVGETAVPTLMALRQAAAESDEALDRLLVQSSRSFPSSRLDLHPLDQEAVR